MRGLISSKVKRDGIWNKVNNILDPNKYLGEVFHQQYVIDGPQLLSNTINDSNLSVIIENISQKGIMDAVNKTKLTNSTTTSTLVTPVRFDSLIDEDCSLTPRNQVDQQNEQDEDGSGSLQEYEREKQENPFPNCIPDEKYYGVWSNPFNSLYIAQVLVSSSFLLLPLPHSIISIDCND